MRGMCIICIFSPEGPGEFPCEMRGRGEIRLLWGEDLRHQHLQCCPRGQRSTVLDRVGLYLGARDLPLGILWTFPEVGM